MTGSTNASTPSSSPSDNSTSSLTILAGVILISVVLSLGLMGIFYVIRNKHLERRRCRRRQRLGQLKEQAATLPQCSLLEESPATVAAASGAGADGSAIIKPIVARPEFLIDDDISNGRELNKLPAVSYMSHDKTPLDFHYVTEFVQCEPNIHVNTALTGVNCCSCQGDCSDGDCACATGGSGSCDRYYDSMGRLSGSYNLDAPELIRECNSACKCNRRLCKNMVIQRGCRARLALFRTRSRGWGVSTLEHLKRGTFIGVYSGELVSVNSSQRRDDDTYLFNLSNNPLATSGCGGGGGSGSGEKRKQEESGADADTDQVAASAAGVEDEEEGAEFVEGAALVDDPSTVVTTSSGQESSFTSQTSETMEQGEQIHDGEDSKQQEVQVKEQVDKHESSQPALRSTPEESNYVCDAKFYGNFTRFINHSCEPNVIGIRTYTVHQDDRFPYIAFFTNRDVPAGTELTLNYGDSYWLVKCKRDRVYCLCRTEKCRFSKKTLSVTMAQFNEKRRAAANT